MQSLQGLIGIPVLIGLAWLISTNRSRFPWKMVLGGVLLQAAMAVILLRVNFVVMAFDQVSKVIAKIISFSDAGIEFVFGAALNDPGGPWGFVFAFKVLPVIIFFASLMAVLYHLKIMQAIIMAMAWLMRRTLGVTGTEAMAMAANVFVGQTEAPLCVRPYLATMTRSQLMTLMVGGFATIAGSVLAAYVGMLSGGDPARAAEWVKHLLTASIMSAPAAFVMAKLLVPETDEPVDGGLVSAGFGSENEPTTNVLDAAAAGASDGLKLALNVAAMLIAFVALLALINWPVASLGSAFGYENWSLQGGIGLVLMPLAWCMGVPWDDCAIFGQLMAEKVVATEFIAFDTLARGMNNPDGAFMSLRSEKIAAYALCGFANFASIGIQIGGLSALAPSRRKDFVALAMKAMVGGAFASWMTACIAGVFIS